MTTWYERLASHNLAKRECFDFVLERTFVCGPHFVGKTRILQSIVDEHGHESNVSSTNYKSLLRNHDREYIVQYMNRRIDNKIYEHSMLQLLLNDIVREFLPTAIAGKLDERGIAEFTARCRVAVRPEHLIESKKLIVLIDTAASFFAKYPEYSHFLRLQVVAYAALVADFQNYAKFVVSFDELDLDETLAAWGVYGSLLHRRANSSSNRSLRIVNREHFDAAAISTILGQHKREIFDAEHLT